MLIMILRFICLRFGSFNYHNAALHGIPQFMIAQDMAINFSSPSSEGFCFELVNGIEDIIEIR
jgi:hypothetical protein